MRLGRETRIMRRIGLTPMIDVVFLLLAFFLIASTFARLNTRELVLSGPPTGPAAERIAPIELVLEAGGGITLAGEQLAAGALEARLAEAVAARPRAPVRIRAKKGVPMQGLIGAMDAAEAAGARAVRFVGVRPEGAE